MQRKRLLDSLMEEATNMPHQRDRTSITWIECNSPFGKFASSQGCCLGILRPCLTDQKEMPVSPPCVSRSIAWVQRRRGGERFACGMEPDGLQPIDRRYRAHCQIERGWLR